MGLMLPKDVITDNFGYRDWSMRGGWADPRWSYSYSPLHAGIDYRMGVLLAPCDCMAFGQILYRGGIDDAAIDIIPLNSEGNAIPHTLFYIRHREPQLVNPDSEFPEENSTGIIGKWVKYKKGDVMVRSRLPYGGYAPHTHFEVNCTESAPLVSRAFVSAINYKGKAIIDNGIIRAEGMGIDVKQVRKKIAKQIRNWGIVHLSKFSMATNRWNKERLCRNSNVGKGDYLGSLTYRIDPLFALKEGIF